MATQGTHPEDDSDMKIALPKAPAVSQSEEEVRRTLSEMEQIRKKGLLLQAEQVGNHMAAMAAGLPARADKALYRQQLWLCVFAVTVGCERCVHNPTTARTVLNAFHDRFRVLCPDAYEDSGYSIALSFYYLAVRSVGDCASELARTFAMLCGDEKNEAMQKLGRETYDRCLERMQYLSAPLNHQEEEDHGE